MGNSQDKQSMKKTTKLKHCQSYQEIQKTNAIKPEDAVKRRKSVGSKKSVSTRDALQKDGDAKKYDDFKPIKKEDPLISLAQEDIIKSSWEQGSTGSIGNRIYLRVFEKRPDLQSLFDAMGRDRWDEEGKQFTSFLAEIVSMLNKIDQISKMCANWGQRHVEMKAYGFKPDFWVTMADAMTTECLYLDAGAHPPADVIGSWATLISLMFSSMRDGYYDRLRKQRKQSQKLRRQSTVQSNNSGSNNSGADNSQQVDIQDQPSRRLSPSPARPVEESRPALFPELRPVDHPVLIRMGSKTSDDDRDMDDIVHHYPGKIVEPPPIRNLNPEQNDQKTGTTPESRKSRHIAF